MGHTKIDARELEKMKEMYLSGMGAPQIATTLALGLSDFVIISQLRKMRVQIRPRGSFKPTVNAKGLEEIREAYQAGQSMKQISKATGRSCFIVRYQLKKLGLWRGARGKKAGRPSTVHAKANEMREMYVAGWNTLQIGRVMGLPKNVIRYQLRKMGTRRKSVIRRLPKTKVRKLRIKEMYLAGQNILQISHAVGLSCSCVRGHLKNLGVLRRRSVSETPQNKKEERCKINPGVAFGATGKEFMGGDRICKCRRCGWSWVPRVPKPGHCPKCSSPYWDRDRWKGNMPRARSRARNGTGDGKHTA